MATLDEANCEKKLRGLSTTQESIQSLSLWIIHHKAHHEKIVDIWFKVLKKTPISHRLTLFYLCNDIVQSCKRKHAVVFKDCFKEILKDAVLLVKESSVRPNVERIFGIWGERKVYDVEFVDDLTAILNSTKVRATSSSKLLTEFKPLVLIEKMVNFKKSDDVLSQRQWQVGHLRLDSSALDAVKQTKDRAHGKEFSQTFEESCLKLEDVLAMTEKQNVERQAMVEMLEQSELYYDAQYGEAKIVANAYKNFGTRVNNLRKRLEEHKKNLPEAMSPVPSPDLNAPSPENSPNHEEFTGMNVPVVNDNIQMMDMEMSDEEALGADAAEPGAGRRDSTTTTRSYPQPIASVTHIQMKTSRKKYAIEDESSPKSEASAPSPTASPVLRLSSPNEEKESSTEANSFLPELVLGAKSTFMSTRVDDRIRQSGDATPVKDEGACTPVQDEQPDPDSMVSNPIEFLQQLISQGQKNSVPSNEGGTSKLLEGLGVLTDQVKNQISKDNVDNSVEETSVPAWNPWDAQQPHEYHQPSETTSPQASYLQTPSPEPMSGPGPFAPSPSTAHPVPPHPFGQPHMPYTAGQPPTLQPPSQQEPPSPQPNYYQQPPMPSGMNVPPPGVLAAPDHSMTGPHQPILPLPGQAADSPPQPPNPWSYPNPATFPHSAHDATPTFPAPGQPSVAPQSGLAYPPSQPSEPSTPVSYVDAPPVYPPPLVQQSESSVYPPPPIQTDAAVYPPPAPQSDGSVYPAPGQQHESSLYPQPEQPPPATLYPPPDQQQDLNHQSYHHPQPQQSLENSTGFYTEQPNRTANFPGLNPLSPPNQNYPPPTDNNGYQQQVEPKAQRQDYHNSSEIPSYQQQFDEAENARSYYQQTSQKSDNFQEPSKASIFQKRLQNLSVFKQRFAGNNRSNLTTVTTHEAPSTDGHYSDGSSYQEDSNYIEDSTSPISTITTLPRLRQRSGSFPPRPPSQPPSPQSGSPGGPNSNKRDGSATGAQREFIEKLKRKSNTPLLPTPLLSSPGPPPRGILKGGKEMFLRTLTEINPSEDKPPEELQSVQDHDHLETKTDTNDSASKENCTQNEPVEMENIENANENTVDNSQDTNMEISEEGELENEEGAHMTDNVRDDYQPSHEEKHMKDGFFRDAPVAFERPERRPSFGREERDMFHEHFSRGGFRPRRPPPPRQHEPYFSREFFGRPPFPRRPPPPPSFERRFRPRY